MDTSNLVKFSLIFGGGVVLFYLLRPKAPVNLAVNPQPVNAKSFDAAPKSNVPITMENADIVANAYAAAVMAGEPPAQLNELNKECMKDFGMKCYMDKNSKLIVCDSNGSVVLTK